MFLNNATKYGTRSALKPDFLQITKPRSKSDILIPDPSLYLRGWIMDLAKHKCYPGKVFHDGGKKFGDPQGCAPCLSGIHS